MNIELLKALGGRSDVLVTLDLETYYDKEFTLKKLTTEAYIRDPRFEVLGIGVKLQDAPAVWLEETEFREFAKTFPWDRTSVLCHHAQFDGLALVHHYGIRPRFWLDTLSMARALHATDVSLGSLAEKYGIGEKGHEVEKTQGKHRGDFTGSEWSAFGDYCKNDVELTYKLLRAMRLPLEELWAIDSTIRMFVDPVFVGDESVLQKAHEEARARKIAFFARLRVDIAGLSSNNYFADMLAACGVDPPTKISPRTGKETWALAKSDPGFQELLEHPDERVRFLAEARLSEKSTIVETRTGRMLEVAKRGRIPFYLRYCGAHTHRWSGGDKLNPQNFNRGGALRKAILAPPGHVLVVVDSSQIEARVLAWLAQQEDLLETFRRNDETGGDFYSDEGSRYFGKKITKADNPVERQIAKSMCLGLGFGMGWRKFALELLKGMLGAPPVQFRAADAENYGVHVASFAAENHDQISELRTRIPRDELETHCAVAAYFVRLYRKRTPRVEALWNLMGSMLERMRLGMDAEYRGLLFQHGRVEKPGGLSLLYPDLRKDADGYTYQNGRKRPYIYGGLLTENVVQSLARDIVTEQLLWIRAAGYRIGTMTHDEIVAVVHRDQAEECLRYMRGRMRIAPSWARGLPLNCTGSFAQSYGDCK